MLMFDPVPVKQEVMDPVTVVSFPVLIVPSVDALRKACSMLPSPLSTLGKLFSELLLVLVHLETLHSHLRVIPASLGLGSRSQSYNSISKAPRPQADLVIHRDQCSEVLHSLHVLFCFFKPGLLGLLVLTQKCLVRLGW